MSEAKKRAIVYFPIRYESDAYAEGFIGACDVCVRDKGAVLIRDVNEFAEHHDAPLVILYPMNDKTHRVSWKTLCLLMSKAEESGYELDFQTGAHIW